MVPVPANATVPISISLTMGATGTLFISAVLVTASPGVALTASPFGFDVVCWRTMHVCETITSLPSHRDAHTSSR